MIKTNKKGRYATCLIAFSIITLFFIHPVYAASLLDPILDGVDSLIAIILSTVLKPFQIILEYALSIMSGEEIAKFVIDPQTTFIPLIESFGGKTITTLGGVTFSEAFAIAGMCFCVINMMTGLYFCMIRDNDNEDHPLAILTRGAVGICFMFTWSQFMDMINDFFFNPTAGQGLFTLFKSTTDSALKFDPKALSNITWGVINNSNNSALSSETVNLILTFIIEVALVISFFRLYMEVVQRWILCNLLYIASPMAFAMLPSKSTSEVTFKYLKTYVVQCLIMVLNIACVQVAMLMTNNFIYATEQADTFITKNVVLYLIVVIGFLQAANKLDNYLSDLGLSAVRTGGGLAMTLGGAAFGAVKLTKGGYDLAKGGAGLANRTIGRTTGHERVNKFGADDKTANIINRAHNQRYKKDDLAPGVGDPNKGVSFEDLSKWSKDNNIGTIRGKDAANMFAYNTDKKINGQDVTWQSDENTAFDPSRNTGHGKVTIGKNTLEGEITRRKSSGSIDLGNGFYMNQDNGSSCVGKDLTTGLWNKEPQSLSSYNAANGNLITEKTLNSVGMNGATHIKVNSDGGVAVGKLDSTGDFQPVGYLSYNHNHYAGNPIKTTTGEDLHINGNNVYGEKV